MNQVGCVAPRPPTYPPKPESAASKHLTLPSRNRANLVRLKTPIENLRIVLPEGLLGGLLTAGPERTSADCGMNQVGCVAPRPPIYPPKPESAAASPLTWPRRNRANLVRLKTPI